MWLLKFQGYGIIYAGSPWQWFPFLGDHCYLTTCTFSCRELSGVKNRSSSFNIIHIKRFNNKTCPVDSVPFTILI